MTATEPGGVPFISVLVPVGTVGDQGLRETLLCLAGQDDTDLEVVLVVLDDEATVVATETVVADQPPRISARVRVVRTDARTPGAVRNAGLAHARGRYVTVLPEGDLVLGSWVRAFRDAEASASGRLVRALGVVQDHALVEVAGVPSVRAQGSPRSESPEQFSLWQHALEPLTQPSAWAWPRALVGTHDVAYDEDVVDDADWELLLRLAQLVGVVDLGVVTSLHRDWSGVEEPDVKATAGPTARDVLDARPLLVPAGEAGRMRSGASPGAAVRELVDELASRDELIRLKDDHIRNIEALLEDREARVTRLQERLDKRTAQVEKLRARLRIDAPAEESPAPGARPTEDDRGRGWFRR